MWHLTGASATAVRLAHRVLPFAYALALASILAFAANAALLNAATAPPQDDRIATQPAVPGSGYHVSAVRAASPPVEEHITTERLMPGVYELTVAGTTCSVAQAEWGARPDAIDSETYRVRGSADQIFES